MLRQAVARRQLVAPKPLLRPVFRLGEPEVGGEVDAQLRAAVAAARQVAGGPHAVALAKFDARRGLGPDGHELGRRVDAHDEPKKPSTESRANFRSMSLLKKSLHCLQTQSSTRLASNEPKARCMTCRG